MAMKTKFINIRIRESNDGEPSCFDIDAGGSLDDILHMRCAAVWMPLLHSFAPKMAMHKCEKICCAV